MEVFTMFKKILSLALVVAMCVSLGALLSSCAGHDHTYSTEWSSDAENHWRPATCEHTEEKKSFAPHYDADSDGKCDVCDYEVAKTDDSGNNKPGGNDKPAPAPTSAIYTVSVKDNTGAAVAGAEVRFFNGEVYTLPKTTDANGQATADLAIGEWQVMLVSVPEGYVLNAERYTLTDNAATIIVTK